VKPYPRYKPSGIEWIGDIPEHWETKKLKFTDEVIMGQSPASEDYNDCYRGLPFLQGNAEFGQVSPTPKIWCDTANKTAMDGDVLLSVRNMGSDEVFALSEQLSLTMYTFIAF